MSDGPGPTADAAPVDASVSAPFVPARDCDELRARAEASPLDAALLGPLCPEQPLARLHLRAELLQAGAPAEAHAMIVRLDDDLELQGLARLAALDRSSHPFPARIDGPGDALVYPIDEAVLAKVGYSLAAQIDAEVAIDERTRARGYLVRVYSQALMSLGLAHDQPMPPFARLLAGRVLYHARAFCRDYWSRRVQGLEALFAETELAMLELVIWLEHSPHYADDGMLAVERQRALRYLQQPATAARVAARAASSGHQRGSPLDLPPLADELDRLVDHGFVDQAVERAIAVSNDSGPARGEFEAELTSILRARDMADYEARVSRRFAQAEQAGPGPRPDLHFDARRVPPTWMPAATLADSTAAALLALPAEAGFPRRHGLARALLAVRERPDALARLLVRDDLQAFHPLLERLWRARDERSLALQRATSPGYRDELPASDAARRRAFALATRDAGHQAR